MIDDTTRRGLLGSAATTALLGLSGCLGATPLVSNRDEETKTFALEDADSLAIDGDTGRVSVTGADREDVRVEIVKESNSVWTDLEDLTLETDRTDGRLELRSSWDGSEGWLGDRPSMELDVELPRDVALERVDTSTGRITVRDVAGDLRAEASNGRIDIADVDGTVSAEASNGQIEIRDVDGTVTAETSNGQVDIADVDRIGDVTTSNGRIDVEVPAIDGETTIAASNGRVTAAVSETVDADLRVETSTGRINVEDLALQNAARSDELVTGRLGDGGPALRIETSTGRVTVRALE